MAKFEIYPAYALMLYGPNGFVRRFSGISNPITPAASLCTVLFSEDVIEGSVRLSLHHKEDHDNSEQLCHFQIQENAYSRAGVISVYRVHPGLENTVLHRVSVVEHGNWYDVTVVVANDKQADDANLEVSVGT